MADIDNQASYALNVKQNKTRQNCTSAFMEYYLEDRVLRANSALSSQAVPEMLRLFTIQGGPREDDDLLSRPQVPSM